MAGSDMLANERLLLEWQSFGIVRDGCSLLLTR
jgi:hypothetical protein